MIKTLDQLAIEFSGLDDSAKANWLDTLSQQQPNEHKFLVQVLSSGWTRGGDSVVSNLIGKGVFRDDEKLNHLEDTPVDQYRVISQIGRGGMGVVYLASHNQIDQQVALKFIYPCITDIHSRESVVYEAKALAKLSHHNIASIHAVGEFRQAFYLVMEYVEGVPIDTFLSEQTLSRSQKVSLILQLCDALIYMHQQGIIHADIKPSNILVTPQHQIKLIDFSISREDSAVLSDNDVVAAYIRGVSRQFASPEQLSQQAVTTLSDLYSLGQVLALAPWQLNTDKEFQSLVGKLCRVLPEERFQSASEVREQLQNLVNHRPVTTYSTHNTYRIRKFIQRNPFASGLASTLGIILAIAGLLLVQQNQVIRAETQRKLELADFITDMYESADPSKTNPGEEITARDLLATSIDTIRNGEIGNQRLRDDAVIHVVTSLMGLGNFPEANNILAFHSCTINCKNNATSIPYNLMSCKLLYETGDYDGAVFRCRSTFDLTQVLQEKFESKKTEILSLFQLDKIDVASEELTNLQSMFSKQLTPERQHLITHLRGTIHERNGNYNDAISQYKAAIKVASALSAQHPHLADYYANLAYVQNLEGDYVNAEKNHSNAIRLVTERYGNEHTKTAEKKQYLAMFYKSIGRYEEALDLFERVLKVNQKYLGEKHKNIVDIVNNQAETFALTGKYLESLTFFQKALSLSIELFGEGHLTVSSIYNNTGVIYEKMGDYKEALKYQFKALELSETLLQPQHPKLAIRLNNLAVTLNRMGKHNEALAYLHRAIEIDQANYSANHDLLASRYSNLSSIYIKLGHYENALENIEKSIAINKSNLGMEHPKLSTRYNNLAKIKLLTDKSDEARKFQELAVSLVLKHQGSDSKSYAHLCINLAQVYFETKEIALAKQKVEECAPKVFEGFAKTHGVVSKTKKLLDELQIDLDSI